MILNIETKNPQQTLKDLHEVYMNSNVEIVNTWETVSEYKISPKEGECVYPLEGLMELTYYGYKVWNIRIR